MRSARKSYYGVGSYHMIDIVRDTVRVIHESCCMWMSHVPNERVMSHIDESCPITVYVHTAILIWFVTQLESYMSHVIYESVLVYA